MRRRPIQALCVALSLLVTGCAVGPDFVRPQPPAVDRYTYEAGPSETAAADGRAQAFEPGARVAADWWRLFNSPRLDGVIAEGIASNPTLQAAQASLRRSQESLRAGYGVFFPQVDAGFDFTRQRYTPIHVGSALPGSIFNLFTLSATVTYALDVFGGQRRAVEGLRADADAQRYTMLAAYLTLSGNTVNAVIAWAAYRAQIQATDELILAEREQLQLTQVQADAGTVPYSNVLSIQSQLAATVATLPPLRQKLTQTEHLLATLVGRTPAEWMVPVVELTDLTLPRDLPVSLPSELVRQRPDILMAEAQLHSSSAAIGVATAAMFPSFVLTATGGLNNTSTTDLFKLGPSGFWALGANVASPLFHGGTLWFQRKAAIAAYEQSLATYRQTVLAGVAQVADALRGLEHDAQAVEAQAEATTAAAEALRLIQANYEAGTANYLQVLIADAQYHQARLGYLQAVAQRLQDTVGLFVALGGGWWNGQEIMRAP
jgi:NodT family efflux transporter outer membrane factor (OMF) lipoprotein